jgi:UMP-CMP kinase
MDQALLFETEICSPRHILYLQCPENVMIERLQRRSETSGRSDDKLDTMRKRLDTFNEVSLPVIRHYMAQGKISKVDATKNKEEVYRDLEVILERVGLAKKDVLDDEPR